jgi:DNA adenine methylase
MAEPREILNLAFKRASAHIAEPIVKDPEIQDRVNVVCRNIKNRACVRLLLAALLAKLHKPEVDIRKPYTEIGDPDAYSGRSYDESFITKFVIEHRLPCNPTTAFLTPALRNRNVTLTPDLDLEGRPKELYTKTLQLLTDVHEGRVSPKDLLAETIRCLLIFRNERDQRIETLLQELKGSVTEDAIPLSAEAIITLMQQHLACPASSRLPVLMVAAAYQAAEKYLGERVLPLYGHTAADRQTGALGDLEITLLDDDNVVTSYEMKTRRVLRSDIDQAVEKINQSGQRINNYIFITTDIIDPEVQEYAKSLYYEKTGGIEFVILDCIGFVRHFLHLFHRLRTQYLERYQQLVLAEPDSSVSQPLKEAFLALRKAAESREAD